MKKKLLIISGVLILLGYGCYQWVLQSDDGTTVLYSHRVASASECGVLETYNTEAKECRYECKNELQCQTVREKVDKSFDDLAEEYPKGAKHHPENIRAGTQAVAVYRVDPTKQLSLTKGKANDAFLVPWRMFTLVVPDADADRWVNEYRVENNPADDTEAFMQEEDEHPHHWRFDVNFGAFGTESPREDILTIIHEYGHLVTLNEDQTDDTSERDCQTFYTGDSCAKPDSYINTFVHEFWDKKLLSMYKGADSEDSTLYDKYPDSFVSEYASSEPSEDIAESWSLFVTSDKPDESNKDITVAEKKMLFFYHYPELVALRDKIRFGLSTLLIK